MRDPDRDEAVASTAITTASGPPGAAAERMVFCADLHGNLGQFEYVLGYALDRGIELVVFGGDLTPKDPKRRTPAQQRAFLAEDLFPLLRRVVNPQRLQVMLILGNNDFRSNRDFVVAAQRAGAPFRLIDRDPGPHRSRLRHRRLFIGAVDAVSLQVLGTSRPAHGPGLQRARGYADGRRGERR
ncbi:metallophosphoesterase [Wenzhouxiangella sp. XN79A]|uniref:metallophosphoesterase n=1 Tax=Wenzhouxiangella sp. XN79A TaxID=2724193 RepID=UPI00144A8F23|nr:metallophosphoesterase family protein [Wenzhouxiangella sp. XN79A]NKI33903.1 metallophosphoesterase [Wenzhouxiangella sp. XN79A]